jgi:uncharacterized protein YdeI (BOF family)
MIKKIIFLVVTSSLISAGLLYLGITMMGQFSPALASSLNALVAETNVQNSADPIPATHSNSLAKELNSTVKKDENTSTPTVVSSSPVITSQAPRVSANMTSGVTPVNGTTIAELLKNPKQFDDMVFTVTGIATALNNEKFLLNDGTGQILVEVEDEMINLAMLSGVSVTVMGELDDTDSAYSIELDACNLNYQNENIVFDDCIDDDGDDDDDGMGDDNDSDNDIDDDGMRDNNDSDDDVDSDHSEDSDNDDDHMDHNGEDD